MNPSQKLIQPLKHSFCLWGFCLLWLILAGAGMGVRQAGAQTTANTSAYERPETAQIRRHMRDILADKHYTPKKNFIQHLEDFFFRWEGKSLNIRSSVGRFLLWVFVIWSVLTLIAILIHFIWTIMVMARSGGAGYGVSKSAVPQVHEKSPGELFALAQHMVKTGNYHEAIQLLMLATLKRLDARGVLRFHASKTNGDYLRDFPRESEQYGDFKTCVDIFERSIYGRLIPAQTAYHQLVSLVQRFESFDKTD